MQAIFSVASGYFCCLSYEFAAAQFKEEYQRQQAAQMLSLSFQWACFLAVFVAFITVLVYDHVYLRA